jgi:hypothetical protein
MKAYEEEHMVPVQSNHDVANHTMDKLLFMIPKMLGLRLFFEGIT